MYTGAHLMYTVWGNAILVIEIQNGVYNSKLG